MHASSSGSVCIISQQARLSIAAPAANEICTCLHDQPILVSLALLHRLSSTRFPGTGQRQTVQYIEQRVPETKELLKLSSKKLII
jgi:hypothetical protein